MLPWAVRVAWLAVPFTVGTSIADALDDRSSGVQLTAAAILWSGWATVVVGLLVPRPSGLVGVRVGGLTAAALIVWSADGAVDWAAGGAAAVVVLVLALAPATGEWLVNGTSYGYERRYVLRAPGPVVAGPIELASLLLPASVATGPLLLAAGQWPTGIAAVALGAGLAFVLFRALYSMTQRWVVLVPAGVVVRDHLGLLDPVLFRRTDIEVLRIAPKDTDALDLTAAALGPALEIRLREEQHIDRIRPVRRGSEPYEAWKLLVTPTRPDALLADAATRNIRVDVEP